MLIVCTADPEMHLPLGATGTTKLTDFVGKAPHSVLGFAERKLDDPQPCFFYQSLGLLCIV